MNRTSAFNWLSALCGLLVVALFVLQTIETRQAAASRKQAIETAEATGQRLLAIEKALQNLAARSEPDVGRQGPSGAASTTDDRSTTSSETQQPFTPSSVEASSSSTTPDPALDALQGELAALEARVGDKNEWPTTPDAADSMTADLRAVVERIPPAAEDQLLPRVNALRWNIYALTLVAQASAVPNESLIQLDRNISTALEAMPREASHDVDAKLREMQSTVEGKVVALRRRQAVAEAERLIRLGGKSDAYNEAFERLSEWAHVPDMQERIQELQYGLQARALADETRNVIASVQPGIAHAKTEPTSSARQIALANLLGTAVSQRQQVLMQLTLLKGAPDAGLAKLAEQLAAQVKPIENTMKAENKSQEDHQARSLREYQQWALEQIQKCKKQIDSHVGKRVPGGVYDSNDYRGINDAMVQYLAPISVGYLDPAVSRLFNETFEAGWKILENNKSWQTRVARQEALVVKQRPKAYVE